MSNSNKSSKETTQRVVTEVDRSLYRRFKSKLALTGTTVRSWFERKMREELDR